MIACCARINQIVSSWKRSKESSVGDSESIFPYFRNWKSYISFQVKTLSSKQILLRILKTFLKSFCEGFTRIKKPLVCKLPCRPKTKIYFTSVHTKQSVINMIKNTSLHSHTEITYMAELSILMDIIQNSSLVCYYKNQYLMDEHADLISLLYSLQ